MAEVEFQYVNEGLPKNVTKGFVDRMRRIVGLEYLSKKHKAIHFNIMNHHLVSKILHQMRMVAKHPDVKQPRFSHFSGTW